MCLAKSSTSNPTRTRRISRVRAGKSATCPEGTLDISRWCKPPVRHNINQSPGPGLRKSRDYIASPLPGLVVSCVRNRWFAPPANFHDASGVHYPIPSPRSSLKKLAHLSPFLLNASVRRHSRRDWCRNESSRVCGTTVLRCTTSRCGEPLMNGAPLALDRSSPEAFLN
jgi:hypothetical protein